MRNKKTIAIGLTMIILFMFPICCTTYAYPRVLSKNQAPPIPNTTLTPTSYREQRQQLSVPQFSPRVGTAKVIVLLIELNDVSYTEQPSAINSTVFGGMESYYYNISYGALRITGNMTNWYRIANNTSDYGRDVGGQIDVDGWMLIRDAISDLNSTINFALYNTVIVVHSGQDQAKSDVPNDIWSSYWSGLDIPTNGIVVTSGIIVSEFDPVGIYCHEFGHSMGLPDLYDYSSSVDDFVGPWDLMAEGCWLPVDAGTSPSSLTSWCKLKLGWISNDSIDVGRNITGVIDPLEIKGDNFTVMKIPISTQTYYLVEVRQQIGWDGYVPSRGVLILYCNDSLTTGNGIVKVMYSHSLTDATYTQAEGNNMFIDNSNNINITVLSVYSFSYEVSVRLIRPDHTPPIISLQNIVPQDWSSAQNTSIEAKITDTGENSSGIKNASVVYSSNGGQSWSRIPMTPSSDDIYSAVILPQNSSEVRYYVEAYDYAGNLAVANNSGQYYVYGISGTIQILTIAVPIAAIILLVAIAFIQQRRKSYEQETSTKKINNSKKKQEEN